MENDVCFHFIHFLTSLTTVHISFIRLSETETEKKVFHRRHLCCPSKVARESDSITDVEALDPRYVCCVSVDAGAEEVGGMGVGSVWHSFGASLPVLIDK
jgi:hypothetical protein